MCGNTVCKELVFFFARLSRFLLVNRATLGWRGSCILWEAVFYAYPPLGCVGADVATVDPPAPSPPPSFLPSAVPSVLCVVRSLVGGDGV
jgi:hypothetical protein